MEGESPARIGFLRELVAASLSGRVDALPSQFDAVWGGVAGEFVLIHFGRDRPVIRDIAVPEGFVAQLAVIDGWNMTIDEVPGAHTGTMRVDLPGRQHVVVRMLLQPVAE
ncbi:DUF5605 domain-containing protein [Microbacterium sp. X-17]|uniref:DUF5605 domain-containing protein n=1 Tax=Microbacterium sp. X-17 TaxID=3144404 RepID=UPI0031F558C8